MIKEIFDSLTKREIIIAVIFFCSGLGVKFIATEVKKQVIKYLFEKKEKS